MIEEKQLKKILSQAPHSPGVYKMLNSENAVIYVGKAKDLSARIKQYFQKNYEHSSRTKKLLENITDLSFTAVDSELEAIILESTLIKQLQPKYNVIMKDDKGFVYIKITKEDFPRIQIVRKPEKDGAEYIGPKTAAHKVNETLKVLKKIFPFRHCNLDIEFIGANKVNVLNRTIKYPCLDHYIKTCASPCIGKCTPQEYAKIIENIKNFLKGKDTDIVKSLNEQMQKFAQNKDFERAAKTRDKIQKIKDILERQKVSSPNLNNQDIINYLVTQEKAYFNLFQIREGKLIGQENFILTAKNSDDNTQENEILKAFIIQYYEISTDIPKEILIPHKIEDQKEFEQLFKTSFTIPKIGEKNKLLEMSLNNAKIFADRNKPSWQTESELTISASKNLQELLKIEKPLKRIECYDISHLSGTETVGSMIVFTNGAPDKEMYRKFRLKTVQNKPDDYKSMEEILKRRFMKIAEESNFQDYTFKKATKKELKLIKKAEKTRTFYILKENKKQVGHISIKEYSTKIAEISDIKAANKEIENKLIKETIKKTKSKRVYASPNKEFIEQYLLLGFEEIKQQPKELEHSKKTFLLYDKQKHQPDKSFEKIPDLIVIDGGKGQLSIATKVLNELKIKIPHISLAKQFEEIFTQDNKVINLEKTSPTLHLLQRARDEAHRFAITYNQKLRSKKLLKNL